MSDQSLLARDLTGNDLGKRIMVVHGNLMLKGTLSGVHHSANVVTDKPMFQPEIKMLGRAHVAIELLEGARATLDQDAPVSLAD